MKSNFGTRFVIEFGSSYSSDPWEIVCICATKEAAKAYIENECKFPHSMYHISEVPYIPAGYEKQYILANENEKIEAFMGDYRWLSNFYKAPITYNGVEYSCTEVAYQAAKAVNDSDRARFNGLDASAAKKLGKEIQLRKDWETIKDKVMYDICVLKFTSHPDLRSKLLSTGDAELIEGNWWGDTYWGVCKGVGKNRLGKTLMKIRTELRESI